LLEDRIRCFEGREQIYGSQFDWDENGQMSPLPIADRENVDERRRAVGLDSLAERTAAIRASLAGEKCPADLASRRRDAEEWAFRVGWR
jgi:hypothetical protein